MNLFPICPASLCLASPRQALYNPLLIAFDFPRRNARLCLILNAHTPCTLFPAPPARLALLTVLCCSTADAFCSSATHADPQVHTSNTQMKY